MKFKVVPISNAIATKLKTAMKDDYGHSLTYTTPNKRMNPCRLCLNDTDPGQKHILASYSPFVESDNPYVEVGPIYIHEACVQYSEVYNFPPDIKKRKYLQVRGYNNKNEMIEADLSEGNNVEGMITKIFENQNVEYIHIRHGQTGCYLLRVERV